MTSVTLVDIPTAPATPAGHPDGHMPHVTVSGFHMNIYRPVLLFLVAILFSLSTTSAASRTGNSFFNLGVSKLAIPNFNHNDAQSALKVWVQTVGQESSIHESVEVRIVDSPSEMQHDLDEDRLDAVVITSEELMQLRLQPDAIYLPATESGFETRYAVVVHRDSGITGLDGLKNRSVAVPQGHYMALARTWLDSQLLDHVQAVSSSWLAEVTRPDKLSKGVLQVFFRQTDAAVLTVDALNVAGELNPQLLHDLIIIKESPPLITSCFLFRPSWQGQSRDTMEKALLNLHATPGGQQVLTVFQSSRMVKQPAAVLEPTLSFLRKYAPALEKSIEGDDQP